MIWSAEYVAEENVSEKLFVLDPKHTQRRLNKHIASFGKHQL